MAGTDFEALKQTIEKAFMGHPVVTRNAYTQWFSHGEISPEQLRQFTVQFSVFSNQFLLAALNRVINADTLESARESKEILLNELGVVYHTKGRKGASTAAPASPADRDREGDPSLVSTEGTVEGGTFRFQAAHFEWILQFARTLGLTFDDLGKRRHGTASTLHFCDELFRLYGSDDYNEAMGASFAVENWAAAGFWKELISGLEKVKTSRVPDLPLAFFAWHDRIEDQHKAHTWDELEACYHSPKFSGEAFVRAGVTMLDGVKVFWDGLNSLRRGTGQVAA
jgi:pyrroloquinoline quinone (PQQ) biosynthesis protein C